MESAKYCKYVALTASALAMRVLCACRDVQNLAYAFILHLAAPTQQIALANYCLRGQRRFWENMHTDCITSRWKRVPVDVLSPHRTVTDPVPPVIAAPALVGAHYQVEAIELAVGEVPPPPPSPAQLLHPCRPREPPASRCCPYALPAVTHPVAPGGTCISAWQFAPLAATFGFGLPCSCFRLAWPVSSM